MRFLILLSVFLLSAPLPGDAAEKEELLKVVVLSRHGVRAPTQSDKVLTMWSQKPWPAWPVEKGWLTPRGEKLVTAMWASLAPELKELGILPKTGCPGRNSIFVRADSDERTKATAAAILAGIAPGCRLGYAVAETETDPLFHPVKAGLYRYSAIPAATDVLKMTHGGLERLQDEFSGALNLMGRISGPPSSVLCSRFALMPKCELADLPNAISVSADGSNVRIIGSLGIASSLAEIFLLEYGQWPDTPAGWGQVDGRVLSQLLPVHSRVFDIVNRAPLVAWANGSSLLSEMSAALFGRHPDKRVNEARLVIFVGHDTNIANVGGLLDFIWQPSGYPPNGIPPAGALTLELWRKAGTLQIRSRFYSQPPKELHEAFSPGKPDSGHPVRAAVVNSGAANMPVAISGAEFEELVAKMTAGAPIAPVVEAPFEYGMAN